MDLRTITADFAVAPQISPADLTVLAEAGFKTVICNRPDEETEAGFDQAAMRAAAQALGLAFHYLPYYPGALTPELVAEFETVMAAAERPVFAYCRSGTRSSHLWAMNEAGQREIPEIIALAAEAGYDHRALEGLLLDHRDHKQQAEKA